MPSITATGGNVVNAVMICPPSRIPSAAEESPWSVQKKSQAELLPVVLVLSLLGLRSEDQMTFAWTALLLSASEKWLPAQSSVLVFGGRQSLLVAGGRWSGRGSCQASGGLERKFGSLSEVQTPLGSK